MLTGASASGLVRAGATGLALRTDTTDRLTIDNSGNVGIGTTSPAGNVGIGVTNPEYLLDLGTAGSDNQLRARRIFANGTGTTSGFTLNDTLIYQDAGGKFNITNPGSYPNVALTIDTWW
jgi:hypothetical protein